MQRREIKGRREKKQGWMEGQNKIKKEECREKYQKEKTTVTERNKQGRRRKDGEVG